MEIFFTSDTHFAHDREFIWKSRGFNSVQEMDDEIIKRWNSIVSPEDIVYHLGDVYLGNEENGLKCLDQLNGHFFFILGNHDNDKRISKLKRYGCTNLAMNFNYNGYRFFLSHYPCVTGSLQKKCLKDCVCNLYGHTHQKNNFFNDLPFMYHVGMDSHNCTPVSIDEIIEEMENKATECKSFL